MQPSDYSHNDHGGGRQSGRSFHRGYHYQDGCGNSFNRTAEYADMPYLGHSCAAFRGSTLPFRHGSWGRGAPFRGRGASSFPYTPPREFRGRPFRSRTPRGRPPHSLRPQQFDSPYPYFKQTRHRDSSGRFYSSPCYKDYSDGAQMGLCLSPEAGNSKLTSQSHSRGMLIHHDEDLAPLERNISPAGAKYSPSRPRESVTGNPKHASPTPTKQHANENESLARQIEVRVSRNAAKVHLQGDLTSKHVSPNRTRTPDCSTAKMQLTSRTGVKREGKSDDLMISYTNMQSPSKITTSTSCNGRTKGLQPAPIKRNRHASSPCKLKSVAHAPRKKSVVSSLTMDSTGTVEQTKGKKQSYLSSHDTLSSCKLKSVGHTPRKKSVVNSLTVDSTGTIEQTKGKQKTRLSSPDTLSSCKLKSVGHTPRKKSVVNSLTVDSTGTIEQTKGKQKTRLSSPDTLSSCKLKSVVNTPRKKSVVNSLTADSTGTIEQTKGKQKTRLSSSDTLSSCKLKSVGHAPRKKSVNSLTVDSTGTVEQTKGKMKTCLSSPDTLSPCKLKSVGHALRKKRVISSLTVDSAETVEHIKGEKGTCLSSPNSLSMPSPEHKEKLNSCNKSTAVNVSASYQPFNKKRCSKHQSRTTPDGNQPPENPVGAGRYDADSTPPPSPKRFHRESAADITSNSVTVLPPSRVVRPPSDRTGRKVPPESSPASSIGSPAHNNVSTESIDGDELGKSLCNSVDLWAAAASTFQNDLHKIPISTFDQIDETTEAHIGASCSPKQTASDTAGELIISPRGSFFGCREKGMVAIQQWLGTNSLCSKTSDCVPENGCFRTDGACAAEEPQHSFQHENTTFPETPEHNIVHCAVPGMSETTAPVFLQKTTNGGSSGLCDSAGKIDSDQETASYTTTESDEEDCVIVDWGSATSQDRGHQQCNMANPGTSAYPAALGRLSTPPTQQAGFAMSTEDLLFELDSYTTLCSRLL